MGGGLRADGEEGGGDCSAPTVQPSSVTLEHRERPGPSALRRPFSCPAFSPHPWGVFTQRSERLCETKPTVKTRCLHGGVIHLSSFQGVFRVEL